MTIVRLSPFDQELSDYMRRQSQKYAAYRIACKRRGVCELCGAKTPVRGERSGARTITEPDQPPCGAD